MSPMFGEHGVLLAPQHSAGRSKRRQRRALAAVGVVVLAGLTYGGFRVADARRVVAVHVVVVDDPPGAVSTGDTLVARGIVRSARQVPVYPRRAGILAVLVVRPGVMVRQNTLIARLQNRAEARAAEVAESTLSMARNALLVAQRSGDRDRIAAETRRVAQVGEIQRRALVALADTYIRAPFLGMIAEVPVDSGDLVSPPGPGHPGQPVMILADIGRMEVEVTFTGPRAQRVQPGASAVVAPRRAPRTLIPARIRQVTPVPGGVRAEVALLLAERRMLPDSEASVSTIVPTGASLSPRVITVPATSLSVSAGQTIVWVVREGRAARQVVNVVPDTTDVRVVSSGLAGGEVVVVDASGPLRSGRRVRILE